jgi:phage-related holin
MMTLAIILIILWLLGFVSSYTFGGLIHLLLVVALVLLVVQLVSGRRAVP